jgi:hypothetical protein
MKPDQSSDLAVTLTRKTYEKEVRKLQARLCELQAWVKHKGLRIMIVFEGPRRRRQGRYHSGSNRACQSPYFPCHRAARALRQREVAVVPPTLHAALSRGGRNRDF